VRVARRYLHWPMQWRHAHRAAVWLLPLLLATGVALYLPAVHTVLIPYLQAVYVFHIALGVVWAGLVLGPVALPPRFAGHRTLSTLDWLPLVALGIAAAATGVVLVLPGLFSATWRALEFTGHGVFAAALAVAVGLHALARWQRAVVRGARFTPERRTFIRYTVLGLAAAFGLPWLDRLPAALLGSGAAAMAAGPTGVESDFITYTAAGYIPQIARATYRLRVDGAVDHPYELTFDQLAALPAVEVTRNFQCVTGWVVPNVTWTGVRLADVVDKASPRPGNAVVEFYSADGVYTDTLSGAQFAPSDVLLAYRLDGAPLSADRGGPVRLVVPEMYGYKSVKWVSRIRVTDKVEPGFWEVRGYGVNAYIGTPPAAPPCGYAKGVCN